MSAETSRPQRVIDADPRTDTRWAGLAAGVHGSVFTSPPWIRAICGTYGFTPHARIAIDTAGHPTGGFVWVPIGDFRGDRLISLPFSDRADPLVTDLVTWRSVVEDALCTDAPLIIRCLDGAVPAADARLTRAGESAWHGTPLGTSLQDVYSSLSSAARRNIETASRHGVRVVALTGVDAVRTYHRLHVILRKRKYHLLAQPLTFFERIWEEFSVDDAIVTLLAYCDGEPIAGAVYLAWNDTLYYKFGASLHTALSLRPNDAVAWAALRWASERGFHMLDWGLSDLDQPGLIAYKRKWASKERRIVTLRSTTDEPFPSGDSHELLEQLTNLLTDESVPDSVTERAGSVLYRYFA